MARKKAPVNPPKPRRMSLGEYFEDSHPWLDTAVDLILRGTGFEVDSTKDRYDLCWELNEALENAVRQMLSDEPDQGVAVGLHGEWIVTLQREGDGSPISMGFRSQAKTVRPDSGAVNLARGVARGSVRDATGEETMRNANSPFCNHGG